jgi:RNA-directed DNA polymerase
VKKSAEGIVGADTSQHRKSEVSRNTEGWNLLTIKGVAKMRKDKKRQKNQECEQLKMYTSTGEPYASHGVGNTGANDTGVELSSRLEQQRALTGDILERIVDYGNIDKAYQQVRKNQGSSGVDGMDVDELRYWLGKNIKELQRTILEEQYQPGAVRKVEIPKPDGGVRILGIPTVKDRLIQQSIYQELNRYYEPNFSEHSYGFRSGRNAHQAILQASGYIAEGKEWVVDIDLEKFFDTINHDRLMQRLSKGIGDKRLLRLLNAYLHTGIMTDGLVEQRIAGTPQGSPLSPLLSNIVLDELDRELEKRGLSFCRYADDCNVFVRSQKAGERVLASLTDFIEKKLKLKVNRKKSGVRHCSDVKFLGYTVLPEGKIRVADKSIERLKSKVKELTKRNRGVKFEQIIKELNAVIIGWTNYFGLANSWLSDIRSLDGWIRRKLRCYRLKQCGRKYTIFKFLRSFEITERTSWNVVMYSQGWWAMSDKVAVKKAMNLLWFARVGLQSLLVRIER